MLRQVYGIKWLQNYGVELMYVCGKSAKNEKTQSVFATDSNGGPKPLVVIPKKDQ